MLNAEPAGHPHFINWFPQLRAEFEYLLQNKCYDDYQLYLNDQYQNYQNPLHWTGCESCAIGPVAACLYNNGFNLANASMQTAGVVLGLLPTILILAGSSKVEIGILALRRPFLAMLISAGSPAVNPLRTVDYNTPADILQLSDGSKRHFVPKKNSVFEVLVSTLQYLIVLAAIANIAEVTYELCFWAVCSFAPEGTFLPALYPVLTLTGHFMGTEAVRRRMQLSRKTENNTARGSKMDIRSKLWLYISRELHLSGTEEIEHLQSGDKALVLRLKEETYAFLFTNWFMSVLATMHLVLGTMVFSSLLFISTKDAAIVALRYLFSTLVARLVLAYELGGLREVTEIERPAVPLQTYRTVESQTSMARSDKEPLVRGTTV